MAANIHYYLCQKKRAAKVKLCLVYFLQSELNKIKSFHILSTSWLKYTLLERLVTYYLLWEPEPVY